MIAEQATLLTGVVTHLPDLFSKCKSNSLTEFTSVTRNDFLTLVESELITLDYMPDLMDTAQTLVSGYFLSAVTLLVDIPEINVRQKLDQLNTRRDPIENILGAGASAFKFVGTESYSHGLPCLEAMSENGRDFACEAFALEQSAYKDQLDVQLTEKRIAEIQLKLDEEYSDQAIDLRETYNILRHEELVQRIDHMNERLNSEKLDRSDRRKLEKEKAEYQKEKDEKAQELQAKGLDIQKASQLLQREKFEFEKERGTSSVGFGRDALATVQELSNLSVGKTLEVVFEKNGNRASVPVTIRLAVTDTDSMSMTHILSTAGIQNTFTARWKRMRQGKLSMVKDLLFCHDLLDEYRRISIQDKSGFYTHMMQRLNRNFLSGLFSLNPSINNASAVLVFSAETAKEATLALGGSLDDMNVREKVFKSTAAMLMFVVDTKWDTVRIYHRGVDAYTTVSKRDLQRKKGGANGNQVSDIINAYQAGAAPTY